MNHDEQPTPSIRVGRTTIRYARFPNEKHEVAVLNRKDRVGTMRLAAIAWGVVGTSTGDRIVPFVDRLTEIDGTLIPANELPDVVGIFAVEEDTRWVEDHATQIMRAEDSALIR